MCTTLLYSGVEYLSIYLFKNNPMELHKVDFMTGYRRLITNLISQKVESGRLQENRDTYYKNHGDFTSSFIVLHGTYSAKFLLFGLKKPDFPPKKVTTKINVVINLLPWTGR